MACPAAAAMGEGRLGKKLALAGCLFAVALTVAGAAIVSFFAWRSYREHERSAADPAPRYRAAIGILGGTGLPDGHHVVSTTRLPGILQGVVLSDLPPDPKNGAGRFRHSLFLYLESRGGEVDGEDLLNLWPGRLVLERKEPWEEGILSRPAGLGIDFRTGGAVLTLGHHRLEGIAADLVFRCPGEGPSRAGLWFRVPAGGEVDHRGDLVRFTQTLQPCQD